jgi:serine/threonine protein kinase
LSQLDHPNIIRLLGYSLLENATDNQYLIYELAESGSLASVLSAEEVNLRSMMDWRKRVRVGGSLVSALAYLHSKNCYHCDVKPDNICFSGDLQKVLLIDFGIARFFREDHYQKVSSNCNFGSHPYMAPEYMNGGAFDGLCEVYSVGFVLKALITGSLPPPSDKPCKAKSMVEEADKVAGEWDKDVLESLAFLAERCMYDGEKRLERPTTEELLRELLELEERSKAPPTPQQKSTIQLAHAQSLPGKDLSADDGTCRCSRKKAKGVFCNRRSEPHFCCDKCLNEHVKDCSGDDDTNCREEGCCAAPYTSLQLCEHVEPIVLAEHLERQLKSRALADKARRSSTTALSTMRLPETNDEILKAINKLARASEVIAKAQLGCPLLFVLGRVSSRGGRRRTYSPSSLFKKHYVLYFVCAHDKTRIECPIELWLTRESMKTILPALKASTIALRIILTVVTGSPFLIPNFFETSGKPNVVVDHLVEVSDDSLWDAVAVEEYLGAEEGRAFELLEDAQSVSMESYKALAELASVNPGWRNKMDIATNPRGVVAWVKKENADKWRTVD